MEEVVCEAQVLAVCPPRAAWEQRGDARLLVLPGWGEEEEPPDRWGCVANKECVSRRLGGSEGATGFGHIGSLATLTRTLGMNE